MPPESKPPPPPPFVGLGHSLRPQVFGLGRYKTPPLFKHKLSFVNVFSMGRYKRPRFSEIYISSLFLVAKSHVCFSEWPFRKPLIFSEGPLPKPPPPHTHTFLNPRRHIYILYMSISSTPWKSLSSIREARLSFCLCLYCKTYIHFLCL